MQTTTIVIPTYNEAKNIKKLVTHIFSLNLPVKILIVDDNSPDGTGIIVEKLKRQYPEKLFILHGKGKLGLGSAYTTGFTWMLKHVRPDIIISMDADLSHDPKYIPNLIKKMQEGHDVVVGTRYSLGGGSNQPWHRIMFSKAQTGSPILS